MMGGCLCGAVRYRLSRAPDDIGWCHCRDCQLNSGSAAMPFANIAVETFTIDSGEDHLVEFVSSEYGRRRFCGRCGTPLFAVDTRDPDCLAINVATLDEPDALPPTYHIYYANRIAWAPACDDLPRYDGSRRDPRATA